METTQVVLDPLSHFSPTIRRQRITILSHKNHSQPICFGEVVPEWYGILGFNVPLDTVQVISETGGSEVHLPLSNGGPAT